HLQPLIPTRRSYDLAIAADDAGDIRKMLHTSDITIAPIKGEPDTASAIFALTSSNEGVTTAAIPTPATPPTNTPAKGMAIISNLDRKSTRLNSSHVS